MKPNNRYKRIEKRFHELVVKHALGTATAEELAKLERYQALRWHRIATPNEIRARAKHDYQFQEDMKALKRCIWQMRQALYEHEIKSVIKERLAN